MTDPGATSAAPALSGVVTLLLLAVAGAAVFAWFLWRERKGRGVDAVVALLVILLVESVLWANPFGVPAGVFHPEIGSLSFRLYEVLIPLALVARAIARGGPARLGVPALAWVAFFAWYAVAAVVGLLRGFSAVEILFSAKAIVYLGGGYALAAGVPAADLAGRRGPLRIVPAATVAAAVLVLVSGARSSASISLPGVEATLSGVGADTASLFVALALTAGVVASTRDSRSVAAIAMAGVLVTSALHAEQRAAVVGLLVSAAVLGVAALTPTRRRRVPTTAVEAALAGLALAGLLTVPVVVSALTAGAETEFPLHDVVEGTFGGVGNRQSSEERLNQWKEAAAVVREQPILGWGLGATVRFYAVGTRTFETSPITHNIVLDLLVRTGLAGLVLFAAATGATLVGGIRAWRSHLDDRVAALALACVAVVAGLLAKGMVESIFEKFRLAVLLGLLLGILRSAATSAPAPDAGAGDRAQLRHAEEPCA